jgi:hypothetical protein
MKRLTSLLIALLSVVCIRGYAQPLNLVSNGDFETVSSYPSLQGELFKASGWSNCNGFTGWPYGSPDLFHNSGSGTVQLPNTIAGSVNAYQGNSVTGFITHNGYVSNFREYLSCNLLTPMEVGETYLVEFYLSNGYANWYGKRGSNGIGVALTVTPPAQIQHEPLPLVPQIEMTSIVHHTDWRRYSFFITVTQPFQYMTIGNFRNDVTTSLADFTTGQNFAYYFMDMVSVSKVTMLSAEALQLQQVEGAEEMELTWHLPSDAAGDAIVLERSMDQQSFETVHDFGTVDNPDADVFYTDAAALPGFTYYYRLRNLTRNGDLQYSSLVEAKFGTAEQFVAGEIYPNPIQERFSLSFAALEDGELTMDILDASGRTVMHDVHDIQMGLQDPEFTLPQDLPAGVYQAKFQFGTKSFSKKLLVAQTL